MDGLRKVPDNVPNQEMLARASRQAADRGPRPVRHARELRRAQQRPAAGLPRRVRLRLRVRLLHRLLPRRPVRRGAAARCWSATTRCGRSMLPTLGPERRATYSPFLPIHPEDRPRACRCRWRRCRPGRGTVGLARRGRQRYRDAGDRRPLQAAVEGRLGAALVRARRRLRDVGQGPDRQRASCPARSAASWAARRRRASPTSCSSTRTARRSASPRATA